MNSSVNEIQESGFPVIPWTVNRQDEMKTLIQLGVAGIITDYPDSLKMLLDELYPELAPPKKDKALGEFHIHGEEGIAMGPIWYDPSKRDPAVIRENVLEKVSDKRKRK